MFRLTLLNIIIVYMGEEAKTKPMTKGHNKTAQAKLDRDGRAE